MKKTALCVLSILCGICAVWSAPSPEQYQGILDLVAGGQIEKAKTKVETYLEIFPEDAQLKAMAEQLDKVVAAPMFTEDATPVSRAVVSEPKAELLISSEDRLEIDTVVQSAQLASKMQSSAARKDAAQAVLSRSIPTEAHSGMQGWLPFWLSRAAMAIEADDLDAGWKAGQALKALNAVESSDALTRKVMASLNMKGWLEDDLKSIQATEIKKLNLAKIKGHEYLIGKWTLNNPNFGLDNDKDSTWWRGSINISVNDVGEMVVSGNYDIQRLWIGDGWSSWGKSYTYVNGDKWKGEIRSLDPVNKTFYGDFYEAGATGSEIRSPFYVKDVWVYPNNSKSKSFQYFEQNRTLAIWVLSRQIFFTKSQ